MQIPIDPTAASPMTAGNSPGIRRLDVRTRRAPFIMLILSGLILMPMGTLLVIGPLSRGTRLSAPPLILGFIMLGLYGVIAWLSVRAHMKSIRCFSNDGLVRNDGKSLAWSDLEKVVERTRKGRSKGGVWTWRIEIDFGGGNAAWVLPARVQNYAEVYALVRGLPCEHAQVGT